MENEICPIRLNTKHFKNVPVSLIEALIGKVLARASYNETFFASLESLNQSSASAICSFIDVRSLTALSVANPSVILGVRIKATDTVYEIHLRPNGERNRTKAKKLMDRIKPHAEFLKKEAMKEVEVNPDQQFPKSCEIKDPNIKEVLLAKEAAEKLAAEAEAKAAESEKALQDLRAEKEVVERQLAESLREKEVAAESAAHLKRVNDEAEKDIQRLKRQLAKASEQGKLKDALLNAFSQNAFKKQAAFLEIIEGFGEQSELVISLQQKLADVEGQRDDYLQQAQQQEREFSQIKEELASMKELLLCALEPHMRKRPLTRKEESKVSLH